MFERPWVTGLGLLVAVAMVFPLGSSMRIEHPDSFFTPMAAASPFPGTKPAEAVKPATPSEPGTRRERTAPAEPSALVEPSSAAAPEEPSPSAGGRLLLDEGFNSGQLDPVFWNTCHWWDDGGCTISSNHELEWYLPSQVSITDGMLNLTAERRTLTASDGKRYEFASGMVTTGPSGHDRPAKLAFTYGKVEARVNLPAGNGLWPAFWLLPASEESRPEIDIMEMLGHDPGNLRMHLHPKDRNAESPRAHYIVPGGYPLTGGWHTLGLDWTSGKLVFLLDGKKVWELVGDEVPAEPMYLVLNLAVGGDYAGPPDEYTEFPATMHIDYVRIRSHD